MVRQNRSSGYSGVVLALALAATLAGCARHHVPIVQFSYSYNEALHTASSEQLLLNLVRLKYGEATYFMQAGNLTTSLRFSDGVQVGVGAPGLSRTVEDGGGGTVATTGVGGIPLAPSVDVSSARSYAPTVVFSPILGDDLVHVYLREMDHPTLAYMLRAGWSVRHLFHLCVERIGLLDNDPRSDSYLRFDQLLLQLDHAQDHGFLMLGARHTDTGPQPVLSLGMPADRVAEHLKTVRWSGDLVPLRQDRARWIPVEVYPLSEDGTGTGGVLAGEDLGIHLVTRSFHDILCFVAKGITVPADHVCGEDDGDDCAGVVDSRNGRHHAWLQRQARTQRLLDVRHSAARQRPDGAAVAVRYRGRWFYIDDTDAASKKTLSLLHKIFALQSGDAGGMGTILTIPVSAD